MEKIFKTENYTAAVNRESGLITSFKKDGREAVLKGGRFGALAFTENNAENKFEKRFVERVSEPALVLEDRFKLFKNGNFSENSAEFENEYARLRYDFLTDELKISLFADSSDFSAVGLSLDLNFLDTDQTGDRDFQLVPLYPYENFDGSLKFLGLRFLSGKWLLVLLDDKTDGWRICYDNEFIHKMAGFQVLKHFDRRLKERNTDGEFALTVSLSFHENSDNLLRFIKQKTGYSIPRINIASSPVGGVLSLTAESDVCNIEILSPSGNKTDFQKKQTKNGLSISFSPTEKGFYSVRVLSDAGQTANSELFAFDSLKDLTRSALNAVKKPYHCDFNLCEGTFWLAAMLKYSLKFGIPANFEKHITEFFAENIGITKDTVTDADIGRIVPFAHTNGQKKYSPYHTYKSERVQNQVSMAMIFSDAYRLFKNEEYKEYAVGLMKNIISDHTDKSGEIFCTLSKSEGKTDYSTVTCLMIGFVEIMKFCEETGDVLGAKEIKNVGLLLADHILRRGFDFPSEGTQGRKETEEGSVSCSALSLLFAYKYLDAKPEYLSFAKKLLNFHRKLMLRTDDVRIFSSTLRFWETNWEGDADGSGINAGHAWALWRGESDFLLAELTGDFASAKRSFNTFSSNFCKVTKTGETYTSFTPDYITGKPFLGKITHSYPTRFDYSMPYYLFARLPDSWCNAIGISKKDGVFELLNCKTEQKDIETVITPAGYTAKTVFFGGGDGVFTLLSQDCTKILTDGEKVDIINGEIIDRDNISLTVAPVNGKITFRSGESVCQ